MKLYVYDHCPFCVRARMPFGLKSIPFDLEFLANDDEDTPIRMIGKKMLPILDDADGYLGESLDIVAKLDALSGPRLFAGDPDPLLLEWLKTWNGVVNSLVIPRTPDPVYPEFETASARAYFTAKKEATFGAFDGLLARTEEFKAELAKGFAELEPLLPDPDKPSINDILLFPILRSLTVMPDLVMPEKLAAYTERMAEKSGVPLVQTLRMQKAS